MPRIIHASEMNFESGRLMPFFGLGNPCSIVIPVVVIIISIRLVPCAVVNRCSTQFNIRVRCSCSRRFCRCWCRICRFVENLTESKVKDRNVTFVPPVSPCTTAFRALSISAPIVIHEIFSVGSLNKFKMLSNAFNWSKN